MELHRIEQAVRELHEEAVARGFERTYQISSGSMRPALDTGDEVVVAAVQPERIHAGDIIVWKSSNPALTLVAHRVLFRKRSDDCFFFRTKGDHCLNWDREWIRESDIVGEVIAFKRSGVTHRIDNLPARLAGCGLAIAMYGGLLIVAGAAWLKQSFETLLPEKPFLLDGADPLFCGSAGISANDWQGSVLATAGYLEEIGDLAGKKIGDATGGGGYSEEASALIRKGIAVQLIPLESAVSYGSAPFDIILMCRLFNHLPDHHCRQRMLGGLAQRLRPGGMLVINWANAPVPGFLRRCARSFWRLVQGKCYQGPCPGDLGVGGCFMGTALETDDAAVGSEAFGMVPIYRDIDGNSRLLVLGKDRI